MKSTVLFSLSLLILVGCAKPTPFNVENELVMVEDSTIEAKTKNGTITIKAQKGLHRTYTWGNCTRSAELWSRTTRWYGSYGAYFPGPGYHWKDNNGIKRGVLDEGQQHFNSLDEAIAWLHLPYHADCVYRNDGLVVCYSKNLERSQLNVSVWQIFIGGSQPLFPPEGAGDRIWFYDPQYKPTIFKNSQTEKYYLGGRKPSNIPGSCNDCILVR